jgi:exonuclease SbcC
MGFSRDLDVSYSRLRDALGSILEGQSPELTVWQGGDYPLLVLQTACDSVGFAVLNGEPRPAFASAYDSFKHLYRQQHSAWKARNLSFVVCRSQPESSQDAFFSSIETDAYFCRKYVVGLPREPHALVQELLRLPFLPLPEGRAGGVLRPPSAQTLLQRLNVSARLARQIIVPREYSAQRIVDQLLTEKEPLPAIGTSDGLDVRDQAQPTERTRIKSVEIEAFRAYRKRREFDVDADVIVFYGPNGLGKTSFFDAIDYVCTGRIGRLCRHRVSQEGFVRLARHLSSSASEGSVSLQVSQGDTVSSVRRSVADWGFAWIGDGKRDRTSVLEFLASCHWEPKKARIENLERLFRATHLFGQSDPELLVEFEQDSTLSSDLVHRMLALDDYASGLAKAAAILAQLDKKIRENKQQGSVLNAQANEVQLQLRALPVRHDGVEMGRQLRNVATRLVKDLQLHADVRIDETEPSRASAREWRAMAESALKDAQDRLLQLQNVESGFTQFLENSSALKHTTAEITKIGMTLDKKTRRRKQQHEALEKLKRSLEQERRVLVQAESRLRALAELGALQEALKETGSSLQQWQQKLKRVAAEADASAAKLQALLPAAESLRNRTAESREAVQAKAQQVQALAAVQDGLRSWEQNHEATLGLQQTRASAESGLETTSAAIAELKAAIAAKETELAACEREYGDLTANQLELTRLLDEMEAHVENGVCPTCGTDHRSKAALVKRIHAQKQVRPAHVEALVRRCDELRDSLRQERELLAVRTGERVSKRSALKELVRHLDETRKSVAAFECRAAEVGLRVDQQLPSTVAQRLTGEEAALRLAQDTLKKLEAGSVGTAMRIKRLEQKRAEQVEAQKRAGAAIAPLEQQSAALRAKSEASGWSLEMAPEEFAAQTVAAASCKAGAEKLIAELVARMEALTQTASELEGQIREVMEQIEALRQDKVRLDEELRRYEESAVPVIGRNALAIDAIREQRGLATERVEELDALRSRCLTLERALDAAQRSALLAELEAQAQLRAREKQVLDDAAERLSAVRNWFTSVRDALDRQSSSAVADHVDAFGPLTSLIQKRLRAVYGFGDVSLLARGNKICVVVGWEGRCLKPADYFSESQKQILMLSLFLASRLTQTWSGFAPILMDDPVTHFDDLNAFGFVELIRGLVSTCPGKRQFFISTCEERLFEVMRQRFDGLEGGVRFYTFEGIGPDGPIVESGR